MLERRPIQVTPLSSGYRETPSLTAKTGQGPLDQFLAWANQSELDGLLLSERPAIVTDLKGHCVLWANPAGAALFGLRDLDALNTYQLSDRPVLSRHIAHLHKWMRPNRLQTQRLQLGRDLTTPLEFVDIRQIRSDFGVTAMLLQPKRGPQRSETDPNAPFKSDALDGRYPELPASLLVNFLAGETNAVAVLDQYGGLLASAGPFAALRPAGDQLQDLLDRASQMERAAQALINLPTDRSGRPLTYDGFAMRISSQGQHGFLLVARRRSIVLTLDDMTEQETARQAGLDFGQDPISDTALDLPSDAAIDHAAIEAEPDQSAVSPEQVQEPAIIAPTKSDDAMEADLHFVWRMDERLYFTFISPEFQHRSGLKGAIEGRSWRDIAGDLNLDADGAISARLKTRAAFTDLPLSWPLAHASFESQNALGDPKSSSSLALLLSAVPVIGPDGDFMGYRGFGTVLRNTTKVATDELQSPASSTAPGQSNPPPHESLEQTRDQGHGLTKQEWAAFKTIAAKLSAVEDAKAAATQTAETKQFQQIETRETGETRETRASAEEPHAQDPQGPPAPQPSATASAPTQDHPVGSAFTGSLLLEDLLATLPLPILVLRDNTILFANDALAQLLGHDGADAIMGADHPKGLGGLMLHPDTSDESAVETELGNGSERASSFAQNRGTDMVLTNQNGQITRVVAHMHTINWDGQTASLVSLQPRPDETGPMQNADQAGPWRADELLTILNTAIEGVLMIDQTGNILAANHGAEALFDTDQMTLQSRNITDLLVPDSRQIAQDYLQSLQGTGIASVLNDGREVVGEVIGPSGEVRTGPGGHMPLFMTIGPVGERPDQTAQRYCVVLRDIGQWKRVEDDLIAARHRAEQANAAKSDFLATISHEIRTPLNAILGFCDLMLEERFGPIGNDRYRDYLRDIHVSGHHLINLINDLLDISKIESGQLDLHFMAIDTSDIARECIALMQPLAHQARVILRTNLPEDLPRIVADGTSLRQILLNILSNAIKFTGEGGQVILSSSLERDGSLTLRIRDSGIGMSLAQIEQAMEPFRQVHDNVAQQDAMRPDMSNQPNFGPRAGQNQAKHVPGNQIGDYKGTGLGLPLTKALVEANRATFRLDSQPDQGTLIEVRFPGTRVLAE